MSRNALFGLLFCCLVAPLVMAESSSGQSIEDVFVKISAEHTPVENIFKDIEAATSFSFLYGKYRIEAMPHRISFTAKKRSVADILRIISRETGLLFRQINSTVTVKTDDIRPVKREEPSDEMIEGTVYDAATNETLPGVNILVKGTTMGTSTDRNGAFEFTVPSLQDTLVASFVGYQTKEVPINGRTELNISLSSQAIVGDEMVVVGYGEQERSSLTSAVSDIDGDVISKKHVFDSRRALQGLAPGVTVIDRGGDPAAANNIQIRIRGNTTIGNNEPLVLVDGVEETDGFGDMNPNDIASITVLKDASATAIYGSRGANGVVLVTTKDAEEGVLEVEYNGYYGVQELNYKPEHLGLEKYMRLQNEAYSNRPGGQPFYTEEEIQEYINADDRLQYPLPNTMWDATFSPAPQQNHSLQFSGGSESINSLLSLSYSNQDGVIPNFSSDKYNVRLNTNFKVNDRIQLSSKITYRKNDSVRPFEDGGVYWRLWHSSQWTVPQYPDGTYGVSNQGHNPYMYAKESGTLKYYQDYLLGNATADVELLDNLTYSLQVSGQIDLRSHRNFKRAYDVHDYYDPSVIVKTVSPNQLTEFRDQTDRLTLRNLLNYKLELENHSISILGGYEQIQQNHERLTANREGFYNNELRNLDAGSQENWSNSGYDTDTRLRSVFGRLNYSYEDRYLLEANARYDGSSKFYGANNQYSFFPSFSAAWRISNEQFWEPFESVISNLKLRGSWGRTGNNSVDLYTFFPGLNNGTYSFGGGLVETYYQGSLTNQDLTWETTTQTDVGIDIAFWEGMLGMTFDYYEKRTDGILLTLPIPGTVGLGAAPQNAGIVDNKGWELTLSHRNILSEDFNYSISANLSDVRNEVIDLAGTGPYLGGRENVLVTKEGEEINALYGYKALGYFESEQEIQNHPTIVDKDATYPGDLKYADLNEDGVINGEDRTVIGSTLPKYTFGITTNLNYRNFDLGFFIQGVGQADAIPIGAAREGGNWEGFTLEIAGDYWTPENTDARFPRREKRSRKNQSYHSSWWVVDASYVKLKNLDVGYTVPADVLQKMGIDIRSLRIFASGTNLFTLSEATDWGLDPEFPSGRLNYYPQTKLYSVGINLEF
ncbi:TonB-linked outer membrane protein, SusC/RagA family [Fodinibius roseus]|uniref:TonB-linked outer membrane protein, SusC/RagA family n=1 Tax=Fodinibius roseus TaxID=1194090 RepID=A0A1M4V4S7_9BACT|nr:TonB-dependent receptor [Fodinibius roseus]SHE63897.1 TonB-linked outer membrane protein, SusC/RagA family [Fodinibius roseus]